MKKLISLIIICTMLFLVSCSSESKNSSGESKSNSESKSSSSNSSSESVDPDKESATNDVTDSSSVTIRCYEIPETEGRAFSVDVEKKAEQIKADSQDSASIATIIKGIDNWTNDSTLNRLKMWIDAELSIEGDDASYYMAFEDGTLFRKNNEGLFVSKGDGKLTEIMDKLCAGRYKDVERDTNGLVTEEGAKKFAFSCFIENYVGVWHEFFGLEKDDTADEYEFNLEKDAENKQMTVSLQKYNRRAKEAVFVIDCEKCCIVEGGSRDVDYALFDVFVERTRLSYENLRVTSDVYLKNKYSDGHYDYILNDSGYLSEIKGVSGYAAEKVGNVIEDVKKYINKLYPDIQLDDSYWMVEEEDSEDGSKRVMYEYPIDENLTVNLVSVYYGEGEYHKRLIEGKFRLDLYRFLSFSKDIIKQEEITGTAKEYMKAKLENFEDYEVEALLDTKDGGTVLIWKVSFTNKKEETDGAPGEYICSYDAYTGDLLDCKETGV